MRDITTKLKSQNAVVSVLVLALLAQMPHAQYVFFAKNHDSSWFGWLQSWGGAVALEVAVLVFVIRGNTKVSWGFAAFSVAINLMYYYDVTLSPYLSPILLSVGLPLAIALYSHEVAERHEAQPLTGDSQRSRQHKPIAKTAAKKSTDDLQNDAPEIAESGTIQETAQTETPSVAELNEIRRNAVAERRESICHLLATYGKSDIAQLQNRLQDDFAIEASERTIREDLKALIAEARIILAERGVWDVPTGVVTIAETEVAFATNGNGKH